ncbi:S-type pyocin family protein [Brevundimonas sp.]|jgi:pyocin large subunit-like protein|uniref:S-type pyocin family protein n=1 Tax=Brevundimonas sp. TaxID=1871086 RepID=UPI0037BE900C
MRLQTGLVAIALLALAACDNASAVETWDRAAVAASIAPKVSEKVETTTTRQVAPGLTVSRTETVDAKIARLYARNGADFGAASAEDYLSKVTAFTTRPPRDAETVKRPNGDTLIYQASTNTFAVVARSGTPRTMFKPTTGADYWAEQKAAAPTFGQRRQSTGDAG